MLLSSYVLYVGRQCIRRSEGIIGLVRQRCNMALTKNKIFVNIVGERFAKLSTIHLAPQQSRRWRSESACPAR